MTFVLARKFGERIVILSDTMITHHPDQRKNDVIPGQLKSVVLSLNMSVAFCGSVVTALDTIRSCKNRIQQGHGREYVVSIIREASLSGCDFILASHIDGAKLIKIVEGSATEPQGVHWLGNPDILKKIQHQQGVFDEGFQNVLRSNPGLEDHRTEESNFTRSFSHLLLCDPMVAEDVGGFATNLLASPYGHCYQTFAGAYSPGPITIGGSNDTERPTGGGDRYAYNFTSPSYRGIAIAGIFMDQAKVGYIYDPLCCDEAIKVPNTTEQGIIEMLNARAKARGGKPEAQC
ncbi:MAG TPA: hypothetical protein VL918_04470 [Sphingobium sp.]|nr:hypothetical protein [Sphingobium sp.]